MKELVKNIFPFRKSHVGFSQMDYFDLSTFQLIYQAAGRSGRGKKRGEVVIQTYDKENLVINAASKLNLKDWVTSLELFVIGCAKEKFIGPIGEYQSSPIPIELLISLSSSEES